MPRGEGGFTDNPQNINKKGRPKGPNKKTQAWNMLGSYILNEGVERYLRVLNEMPDREFVKHFQEILEFFKPKQSRHINQFEGELPTVEIRHIYNGKQFNPQKSRLLNGSSD